MKNLSLTLIGIGLFFTLTAEKCAKAETTDTTSMPNNNADAAKMVPGRRWNLESLAGKPVELGDRLRVPFISTTEDGQLSGFGGCNSLMGSVKMEGDKLTFSGLGSTKKMCPDSQAMEDAFMKAMRATNSFRLERYKLTLLDGSTELATLRGQDH